MLLIFFNRQPLEQPISYTSLRLVTKAVYYQSFYQIKNGVILAQVLLVILEPEIPTDLEEGSGLNIHADGPHPDSPHFSGSVDNMNGEPQLLQ